jgi:hypothetical protein
MNAIELLANDAGSHRARDKRLEKRPRSSITSGRKLFINGDPNSAWARRFFDITQGLISDAGGRGMMSEAKYALCKRAAALQCELEQLEGRLSQGEEVDLDKFGRAASHLRRILETLGLERHPIDITRREIEDREAGLIA